MKKIITYSLLFIYSISFAQIKFGPRIGVDLSSAKVSLLSPNLSTKVSSNVNLKASYTIGGTAEARIGDAFAIQLSFLLINKGYSFIESYESKTDAIGSSNFRSSVITNRGTKEFLYMDMPVNVIYKKDLGIGKVLLGLGGYFSYNIWGVSKEKNTYVVGSSSDLSLTSLDGTYDLKKSKELSDTDYGASIMTGLEFNEKTQLTISYNHGLADINPGEATVRNRAVSITFAYLFGDN